MKPEYEIMIYWSDEDNSFIAEVPELAGCKSEGKTYSQALENVQLVINEWIETAKMIGKTVPAPKGKLLYA